MRLKLRKYRDFSEMPDDALRSFAGDLAKLSSGKTIKEIRNDRAALRAAEQVGK